MGYYRVQYYSAGRWNDGPLADTLEYVKTAEKRIAPDITRVVYNEGERPVPKPGPGRCYLRVKDKDGNVIRDYIFSPKTYQEMFLEPQKYIGYIVECGTCV